MTSKPFTYIEVLSVHLEADPELGEPPYIEARCRSRFGGQTRSTMSLQTFLAEVRSMQSYREAEERSRGVAWDNDPAIETVEETSPTDEPPETILNMIGVEGSVHRRVYDLMVKLGHKLLSTAAGPSKVALIFSDDDNDKIWRTVTIEDTEQ